MSAPSFSLTDAERAWIWRRRHGLGQTEMAKRAGVHPDTYGERERGVGGRLGRIPHLVPEPWERCAILRRRAGLPQWKLARRMRVSRHIIMAWERGEYDWARLAQYWGIR